MINIKIARESIGLSGYMLAKNAGIDHSTLLKIEQGKSRPLISTYEKITAALKDAGYKGEN